MAWCLSSAPASAASLYDHARLSAAIAGVLWSYHQQIEGTPSVEKLRDTDDKFLLVVGDFGGIQSHIYHIQRAQAGTGGMAKRLRSRSLEVSLAAEALALGVLEKLSLPPLARLMSAGGKSYLLLPNTDASRHALAESQRDWEAWALEQGATLSPFLAAQPFGLGGFRTFQHVLNSAHRRLATTKLRPFSSWLGASPYLDVDHEGRSLVPCTACGLRPAAAPQPLCSACERDQEVGRLLPRVDSLGAVYEPRPLGSNYPFPGVTFSPQPGSYTLRSLPAFSPAVTPWEVRPVLGHLPQVQHAMRALELASRDAYTRWLDQQGLTRRESDPQEGLTAEQDRPLTFGEIASLSRGAPYPGALMLDADRMGEAFAKGFGREEKGATASQITALSRALDWFFGIEVANLIEHPEDYRARLGWSGEDDRKAARYPLLYTVYAGGDDLFLLGPWDVVLALQGT